MHACMSCESNRRVERTVCAVPGMIHPSHVCTVQERNHRSLFTLHCALKEQTHALAQDAVFKQCVDNTETGLADWLAGWLARVLVLRGLHYYLLSCSSGVHTSHHWLCNGVSMTCSVCNENSLNCSSIRACVRACVGTGKSWTAIAPRSERGSGASLHSRMVTAA